METCYYVVELNYITCRLRKIRCRLGVKLINRFHACVRLFSNRSQMTSECGENKKVANEAIAIYAKYTENIMFICAKIRMLCLWSMLLSYFDVFYDLLLNRHTATWNLLVLHHRETKNVHDVIYTSVLKLMISKSQCENNLSYNINNRENITIILPSQTIPFAPGLCSG